MAFSKTRIFLSLLFIGIAFLLVATGCNFPWNATPAPVATATPSAPATVPPTQAAPSATPSGPLAAKVNGEGILASEVDAELQRFQEAEKQTGKSTPADQARKRVVDDLVDQTLLAQAAVEDGYKLDEAAFKARLDQLTQQAGGAAALADWQKRNNYDDASFQLALRRSIAAAWERDKIINAVPATAEQVHALQILVLDEGTAQKIEEQLQTGAKFATLVQEYDPLTGGELGWFPRGYLTQPDIESAAFNLQPGQFSQVIKTSFGYHIIEVVEKDEKHPLSPDARQTLQLQALDKWLQDRRAKSTIEIE
jgi:peptidyl-prolyl cis-trans isomerase C